MQSLYYEKEIIKDNGLRASPSNDLSVPHLLQNNPKHWLAPTKELVLVPKIIVLGVTTQLFHHKHNSYLKSKIDRLILDLLKFLLKNHDIYLVGVIPITKTLLIEFEERQSYKSFIKTVMNRDNSLFQHNKLDQYSKQEILNISIYELLRLAFELNSHGKFEIHKDLLSLNFEYTWLEFATNDIDLSFALYGQKKHGTTFLANVFDQTGNDKEIDITAANFQLSMLSDIKMMKIDEATFRFLLKAVEQKKMLALEYLIDLTVLQSDSEDFSLGTLNQLAPNLKKLSLSVYSRIIYGSNVSLNITELNLEQEVPEFNIIEICPKLETINLFAKSQFEFDDSDIAADYFANLKHLTLRGAASFDDIDFITEFAKNLESLVIECLELAGEIDDNLKQLPKLTKLKIFSDTKKDYTNLVKSAPNLQYLAINNEVVLAENLKLHNLEVFTNYNGAVTNFRNANLPIAPNLKVLNISTSQLRLLKLASMYPLIESFTCYLYDARILQTIADKFLQLKYLRVNFGPLFDAYSTDWVKQNKSLLQKLVFLEITYANSSVNFERAINQIAPNLLLKVIRTDFSNTKATSSNNQSQQAVVNDSYTNQTGNIAVDANTKKDITNFNINRLFFDYNGVHPYPSLYRLKIFTTLQISEKGTDTPFILNTQKVASNDLLDIKSSITFLDSGCYQQLKALSVQAYYCPIKTTITKEWQSLPSLHNGEKIIYMQLAGVSVNNIDVYYHSVEELYYIRANDSYSVFIEYIVDVPKAQPVSQKIAKLVQQFRDFSDEPITVSSTNALTGKNLLATIIEQKRGVCRHRAVAFKYIIDNNPDYQGIQARVVSNHIHMFVETNEGNGWVRCDLGGGSIDRLNVYDSFLSKKDIDTKTKEAFVKTSLQPKNSKKQANKSTSSDSLAKQYNQNKDCKAKTEKANLSFKTWQVKTSLNMELRQFVFDSCISLAHKGKNNLILFTSENACNNFALILQQACLKADRPVYIITNPEELQLAAKYIKLKAGVGQICNGPGGPLYDFLVANNNKATTPVLLVNYVQFTATQIVKFNQIIDKKNDRQIDGVKIPDNAVVVGLHNEAANNAYKGADFYSRFNSKYECPYSDKVIETEVSIIKDFCQDISVAECDSRFYIIDLYESTHWQAILLGSWRVRGKILEFESGRLVEAINANQQNIVLKNAPWHDKNFVYFIEQLIVTKKHKCNAVQLEMPANFRLYKAFGYNWQQYLSILDPATDKQELCYTLNPSSVGKFINDYYFIDGLLQHQDGILAKHKNQKLYLLLTRELTSDQWGHFLQSAKHNNVKLSIKAPATIKIPQAIKDNIEFFVTESQNLSIATLKPEIGLTVIKTNKPYLFTKMYLQKSNNVVQIDVSELEPSDIFIAIAVSYNQDGNCFTFKKQVSDILDALLNKATVVLTGDFKPEMIDAISSLALASKSIFFNGKPIAINGRLIIIADLDNNFAFVNTFINLSVLPVSPEDISPFYDLDYTPANETVDFKTNNTDEFNNKRALQITNALKDKPYVFIAGLTGVGKTTFIKNHLDNNYGVKVFYGLDNLEAWAKDIYALKVILFIDEANTINSDYTIFYSLYNNEPAILVNGKYIRLNPDRHKVIFAGNPLSTGGDRKIAKFFADFPNIVVFDPLPGNYLYHNILKPLYQNFLTSDEADMVTSNLLNVYQYVVSISQDKVLLTPRELKTIVQIIISNKDKSDSLDKLMLKSLYSIVKLALPTTLLQENFNNWFIQHYGVIETILPEVITLNKKFLLTESREEAFSLLKFMLYMHKFKQSNSFASVGGLAGLVLEGEPGVGKTKLLIATLQYLNIDFIRINATATKDAITEQLIAADSKKVVVLFDELNTASLPEEVLNEYLMRGNILLLATQNPASMGARYRLSTALQRRLICCKLKAYTEKELIQIMRAKGLSLDDAKDLVRQFLDDKAYAIANKLQPEPVFRDLEYAAKNYLKATTRKNIAYDKNPSKPSIVSSVNKIPEKPSHISTSILAGISVFLLLSAISILIALPILNFTFTFLAIMFASSVVNATLSIVVTRYVKNNLAKALKQSNSKRETKGTFDLPTTKAVRFSSVNISSDLDKGKADLTNNSTKSDIPKPDIPKPD